MNTFRAECPNCQSLLKIDESAIGKTKRCPKCKEPILINSVTSLSETRSDTTSSKYQNGYNKKQLLAAGMLFLLLFFVISIFNKFKDADQPKHNSIKTVESKKISEPNYELLEDIKYTNVKRMLKIKLPRRMTEKELREFSYLVRHETPKEFKYLSIWFYIPEIPIKNGIWANAKFYSENLKQFSEKPEKIQILCLTVSCFNELVEAPLPEADKIIGSWIVERPHVSSRKVLYKKNGQYFCEDLGCGYSGGGNIYPKTASMNETKFVEKGETTDEFYLINQAGDLELHSEDGCYAIGKKLPVQKW